MWEHSRLLHALTTDFGQATLYSYVDCRCGPIVKEVSLSFVGETIYRSTGIEEACDAVYRSEVADVLHFFTTNLDKTLRRLSWLLAVPPRYPRFVGTLNMVVRKASLFMRVSQTHHKQLGSCWLPPAAANSAIASCPRGNQPASRQGSVGLSDRALSQRACWCLLARAEYEITLRSLPPTATPTPIRNICFCTT